MSHSEARSLNIKHFSQEKADDYDKRMEIANQSLVLSKILLSVGTSYIDELPKIDLSDVDLTVRIDRSLFLRGISDGGIFRSKEGLKILDFACGTGLVTYDIASHLLPNSKIVGIDISQPVLNNFNDRFKFCNSFENFFYKNGIEVVSYRYDILDNTFNVRNSLEEPKELNQAKFDIVYCTISYHHLEDIDQITARLSGYLAPNGTLIILDFYNSDIELQNHHDHHINNNEAVRQLHGISRKKLLDTFGKAGLVDIRVEPVAKLKMYRAAKFIKNHCSKENVEKLEKNELKMFQILEADGTRTKTYLVENELVMAIGKKGN
ncbi:hypothetical protein PACTADRAFT_48536 [Pachysolen tannophilus NRRL Y-2460]|uniref:Methyltransferase type 12 domain-containing protein n=1 Tax=Pachysolen tannophilus NRRL Y-2460 TaxID=669874 RepID=A0A1E4TYH7_PACTA|nr:hypothetical protein PACTADRAFT_48536 [Pachysolen tannophilus NRRL Y-2460]